jgi:aspartyl-tRNA(Asn)/glutamyl-tRNA(Gln) amidotransferase subunit A
VAVKDLFDTAGVRTTYGSAVFAEHVPAGTAEAVRLLEQAGYTTAGKTNLHEFAYGITSQNPHYGTVPNPRWPGRTAGGSSGGTAAAIAAGLVDLGLGTDSGGSIRIPAACCGVAGFKPTYGLVPIAGVFPLAPSFDHAGPMARGVAGCVELMGPLAGLSVDPVELGELRVGVSWTEHAEPLVRARVDAAAALFPRGRKVPFPEVTGTTAAFMSDVAGVHRELFAEHAELYGDNVRTKVERCLAVTDAEVEDAAATRRAYAREASDAFEGLDLLVVPTMAFVPPPVDVDDLGWRDRVVRFTYPFNVLGWPALALPCGLAEEGLPASVQLVGRPGEDALVLAAGLALEEALRGA